MDIDDYIGQLGWYQLILWFWGAFVQIPSGINAVISVFTSAEQPFRCATCFDNSVISSNYSNTQAFNQTNYENFIETSFFESEIKTCEPELLQCKAEFDVLDDNFMNSEDLNIQNCCSFSENDNTASLCTEQNINNIQNTNYTNFQTCDDYIYDTSVYETTVRSEWNLVCKNAWLAELADSLFFVGFGVGGVIAGILCDKYGRKPVYIASGLILQGCCIALAYSTDFIMYAAFRLLVGIGVNASIVSGYTLCVEYTGSKYRSWLTMFFECTFSIGEVILSGFAAIWNDWRGLQFAISFWAAPLFLVGPFLPESYRWYMAKNDKKRAVEGAVDIMRKNKQPIGSCFSSSSSDDKVILTTEQKDGLRQVIEDQIDQSTKDQENRKSVGISNLFTVPDMRKVTLNLMYNWFTNSMVYYGLALNAGALPGSDIFNHTINSLSEFPAYFVFPFFMDSKTLGRRGTLGYFLIGGGLCCLISTICLEIGASDCEGSLAYMNTLGQVFAFTGKFFLSGTFGIDYAYSSEIYPSEIRSIGLSTCSLAARVAGVLSPFILSLSGLATWLPGGIFSFLGITAGLLTFLLPETNGMPLLTTLEETKNTYFSK